jgi:signal transduction histidine kinase
MCIPVNKFALSSLLPTAVLQELIPSFEAAFDLPGKVCLLNPDHSLHYGAEPNGLTGLWASLTVEQTEIGQVGLMAQPDDQQAGKALDYLVVTLGRAASDAWRQHLLAEEVLQRYDELNLMYGLGTNFVQGMNANEIVQNVLEETNRILLADAGAIYLTGEDNGKLEAVSFFGEKATPEFWNGRVRELALSTLYAYDQAQTFDGEKLVCAPLRYDEEMLGSLVLMHEQPARTFRANDVNLLTTLMQNTALFIHAARVVSKLNRRTTELETTLNELKHTQDALSRAERLSMVGQVVGTLVHDMKKPLANMMGYAGLLQDPDVTYDERYEWAGLIIKYVDQFSAMAQEILDYMSGNTKLDITCMDAQQYLEMTLELINPPGLERPVKVVLESEAVRGLFIKVDSVRYARIFQNLLNNASDAIIAKGGSQVVIQGQPVGDLIAFSVTDDGPGIPEKIRETLFEPFVTEGKTHGTGLGLAIVQQLVEAHHGTIHYENAEPHGARFVFTLPWFKNCS